MELRTELLFKASRGPKLELTLPDEEGEADKLTLGLKGALNKSLATELGIGWMYASETVAHGGLKDAKLNNDIAFTDCELKLLGDQGELDTFFPEKIYSFRAFAIGGAGLGIQCRVDISGDFNDILDFFRRHISTGFEFIIKPRQGKLFEGGTRVELGESDEEISESDIPVVAAGQGDGLDRSHENRPKGGKRGRPRKIVDIGSTRDVPTVEASEDQSSEWDEFYEKKSVGEGYTSIEEMMIG